MKLKLRAKLALRDVVKGNAVVQETAYAIEVYVNHRWAFLGDGERPMMFKTAAERNEVMERFQGKEAEAS
jgi:hypothetical protein